jgi:hypothetical protein
MTQTQAKQNTTLKNTQEDTSDIDQIIKEIEELEQSLDAQDLHDNKGAENVKSEQSNLGENMPQHNLDDIGQNSEDKNKENNVVEFKPKSSFDAAFEETESEDVEDFNSDELTYEDTQRSGVLGLKVSGATQVYLDFEKEGIKITVQCTEKELTICTDQGAEFKIPFQNKKSVNKKAA